jgi:hypothetical protein
VPGWSIHWQPRRAPCAVEGTASSTLYYSAALDAAYFGSQPEIDDEEEIA